MFCLGWYFDLLPNKVKKDHLEWENQLPLLPYKNLLVLGNSQTP